MFKKAKEEFGAITEGYARSVGGNEIFLNVRDSIKNEDLFENIFISKDRTEIDMDGAYKKSLYDEDIAEYEGALKHFYFIYSDDNDDNVHELFAMFQFDRSLLTINCAIYDETMIDDFIKKLDESIAYINDRLSVSDDYTYRVHAIGIFNEKERKVIRKLLTEIKLTRSEEKEWERL